MKLGIISDTHGLFDERLVELLAGASAILHAGDVGTEEVLYELRRIAPVEAVRGNTDSLSRDLPLHLTSAYEGVQLEILHQLPAVQADVELWATERNSKPSRRSGLLRSFDPQTRVVIFGHTHKPCLAPLGGKLFFNPGSAGCQRFSLPRSCGLLKISASYIQATVLGLERYNKIMEVRLPLGG